MEHMGEIGDLNIAWCGADNRMYSLTGKRTRGSENNHLTANEIIDANSRGETVCKRCLKAAMKRNTK